MSKTLSARPDSRTLLATMIVSSLNGRKYGKVAGRNHTVVNIYPDCIRTYGDKGWQVQPAPRGVVHTAQTVIGCTVDDIVSDRITEFS